MNFENKTIYSMDMGFMDFSVSRFYVYLLSECVCVYVYIYIYICMCMCVCVFCITFEEHQQTRITDYCCGMLN